jgi:hypothetical protein
MGAVSTSFTPLGAFERRVELSSFSEHTSRRQGRL